MCGFGYSKRPRPRSAAPQRWRYWMPFSGCVRRFRIGVGYVVKSSSVLGIGDGASRAAGAP